MAHGYYRTTLDIDIFIEASPANADAAYKALAEFGAPLKSLKVMKKDFASEGTVIQIGVDPQRIDIISKIDGVSFDEAYSQVVYKDIDGMKVPVISLEDFLTNKKASNRLKDKADIAVIEHMIKTGTVPKLKKQHKTSNTRKIQ